MKELSNKSVTKFWKGINQCLVINYIQTLNIPQSATKSIIKKSKVHKSA